VRNGPSKAIELYDLTTDPGEKHDRAATRPDLVQQADETMVNVRTEHPDWPLVEKRPGKGKGKKK
jgi:hypothetical protein